MEILALSAAAAPRCGSKAAALARLRGASLPVPNGCVLTAEAYRSHLAAAGVEAVARQVFRAREDSAHRLALEVRLGLLQMPLSTAIADGLARARCDLSPDPPSLLAVRSSALHEGGPSRSFAGQLETFLAVADHADLLTAVRACWASLWSPRAVRYMLANGVNPAATAVAVLVQPLVPAMAAGGALSATDAGRIVLTAAWGLGPAVAQGEVVPDRYVLRRDGPVLEDVEAGRKSRMLTCSPDGDLRWQPVTPALHSTPCLDEAQAPALARLVLRVEAVLDAPVEIEWALDAEGFHLLQARPAPAQRRRAPGPASVDGVSLTGQPAGSGWAAGPARLVRSEAELNRVRPGDVLVTRVPGPALAAILPRVVAVVAELGGSTSHLAALARERRIPAVLGAGDATRRIPEGARVVVDGNRGVVHIEQTDSRRG
ncbi:MAG: pyruvate, phosphate dikinase [Candidatus Rokubacteria bacterium]|nr:pyruvate, phosphate dikinase [Candidatus Rokubacteria bacterium]